MAVSQNSLSNEGIDTEPPAPAPSDSPVTPVPGAQAAATPAPAAAVEDDLDRELRLTQERIAKEAGAPAAPAAPATPGAPAAPAAAAPAAPVDGQPKPQPKMVPLAVATAERDKRQQAEREAAYYRGIADAATANATGKPLPGTHVEAPPPAETPQQAMERIKAEQIALADQYDQGTIKTVDWERQRQALNDQEWNIRAQTIAPPAQAPIADQLYEEQATQRLEAAYPILNTLQAEDFQALAVMARREAAREGVAIPNNALGTIQLRERVAKLAVKNFGNGAAPASPQPPGTQPAHRNASAADLAVNHPVNVSNLGAGAQGTGMTDAQANAALDALTTEDQKIAFLNANPAIFQRAMQRASPG